MENFWREIMFAPFKRIKQRWMNYLNRMARVNQKLYGEERLDCCDLSRPKKENRR